MSQGLSTHQQGSRRQMMPVPQIWAPRIYHHNYDFFPLRSSTSGLIAEEDQLPSSFIVNGFRAFHYVADEYKSWIKSGVQPVEFMKECLEKNLKNVYWCKIQQQRSESRSRLRLPTVNVALTPEVWLKESSFFNNQINLQELLGTQFPHLRSVLKLFAEWQSPLFRVTWFIKNVYNNLYKSQSEQMRDWTCMIMQIIYGHAIKYFTQYSCWEIVLYYVRLAYWTYIEGLIDLSTLLEEVEKAVKIICASQVLTDEDDAASSSAPDDMIRVIQKSIFYMSLVTQYASDLVQCPLLLPRIKDLIALCLRRFASSSLQSVAFCRLRTQLHSICSFLQCYAAICTSSITCGSNVAELGFQCAECTASSWSGVLESAYVRKVRVLSDQLGEYERMKRPQSPYSLRVYVVEALETWDASESIDRLYERIWHADRSASFALFTSSVVQIMCHWVVAVAPEHRHLVASVLECCVRSSAEDVGVARLSIHSSLMAFLQTVSLSGGERRIHIISQLFGELLRVKVFSAYQYACDLIARGLLNVNGAQERHQIFLSSFPLSDVDMQLVRFCSQLQIELHEANLPSIKSTILDIPYGRRLQVLQAVVAYWKANLCADSEQVLETRDAVSDLCMVVGDYTLLSEWILWVLSVGWRQPLDAQLICCIEQAAPYLSQIGQLTQIKSQLCASYSTYPIVGEMMDGSVRNTTSQSSGGESGEALRTLLLDALARLPRADILAACRNVSNVATIISIGIESDLDLTDLIVSMRYSEHEHLSCHVLFEALAVPRQADSRFYKLVSSMSRCGVLPIISWFELIAIFADRINGNDNRWNYMNHNNGNEFNWMDYNDNDNKRRVDYNKSNYMDYNDNDNKQRVDYMNYNDNDNKRRVDYMDYNDNDKQIVHNNNNNESNYMDYNNESNYMNHNNESNWIFELLCSQCSQLKYPSLMASLSIGVLESLARFLLKLSYREHSAVSQSTAVSSLHCALLKLPALVVLDLLKRAGGDHYHEAYCLLIENKFEDLSTADGSLEYVLRDADAYSCKQKLLKLYALTIRGDGSLADHFYNSIFSSLRGDNGGVHCINYENMLDLLLGMDMKVQLELESKIFSMLIKTVEHNSLLHEGMCGGSSSQVAEGFERNFESFFLRLVSSIVRQSEALATEQRKEFELNTFRKLMLFLSRLLSAIEDFNRWRSMRLFVTVVFLYLQWICVSENEGIISALLETLSDEELSGVCKKSPLHLMMIYCEASMTRADVLDGRDLWALVSKTLWIYYDKYKNCKIGPKMRRFLIDYFPGLQLPDDYKFLMEQNFYQKKNYTYARNSIRRIPISAWNRQRDPQFKSLYIEYSENEESILKQFGVRPIHKTQMTYASIDKEIKFAANSEEKITNYKKRSKLMV